MNATEAQIIDLILSMRRHDRNSLLPSTSINIDLGIDGDDAEELIALIEKRFNVSLPELRNSDFFGTEQSYFPIAWLRTLLEKEEDKSALQPLTIKQIVALIDSKRQ